MRHLLIYLKDYKKECILAPLFKMLEASFELFIPLVIAGMIDKGMAAGDMSYIVKSVCILLLLAVVGLISAVTAQYFSAKAATGFSTGVRKDLFSHLMRLSFKEYDEIGSSTMITRMTSDVMQTQTGVNMFLRLTLRSPFVVVGAMVMAFTVDAFAASIFALVIIILSVVVALVMKANIPLLEKTQGFLDKVLLITRENLIGIRVLRAFSREDEERKSFDDATNELYRGQTIAGRVSAIMNPATYVIINMAVVALIYVGAIRVNGGNLSQGSVVALYNYMSQILVELIKLANMIVILNKAIASGNRIYAVMSISDSQEYVSDDKNAKPGFGESNDSDYVVEFDKVSFRYNAGGDEALSDISFKVKKGETVGIIGGTGSGKSTLVSLIPRFYDATAGSVKVFGKDVIYYGEGELNDFIGFVFQKASLFSGSIADNLRFGKSDATAEEMKEAMELAVAGDVLTVKGGLEAQVKEGGMGLSGGQRQRVTIARALIKKPPVLIFDDSTSALDFATQVKFLNNLTSLTYKPTIFIVSQRTNAMIGADHIIVLDDGNMVGYGKHSELLENCPIYKEIYDTQFANINQKEEEK